MELDQHALVRQLQRDRASHKLIHDTGDDRWFVYEFDSNPPAVTSVPKELAKGLLRQGLVEPLAEDTRVQLPGDDFVVYGLSDEGAKLRS